MSNNPDGQNLDEKKSNLIWASVLALALLSIFLATKVLGGSKVIRASSYTATLDSGLRIELTSVLKFTGDFSDPNRMDEFTPAGEPISARESDDNAFQSATSDVDYIAANTERRLRFRATSRDNRAFSIRGFIPDSNFDRSIPTYSGTFRSELDPSLDESGTVKFQAVVGCAEPSLSRYVLQVSDLNWRAAALLGAVKLDGRKGEVKEVDTRAGKISFTVHRYSDYSGGELHPDYVHIEFVPATNAPLNEYRILIYDLNGSLLQFPYGLKRIAVPSVTDFPIDLWKTVGRIEVEKRSTEFVEFTNIRMNRR